MDAGNIVFGFNHAASAYLVIGTYGQAEGAGADIGRTEGGFEFAIEREVKDVETDQDLGPVGAVETRRVGSLKFSMAEGSLANMALAFNLPSSAVVGTKLSLGAANAQGEIYKTVYMNTDGPANGTRKYTFHKCVIIGSGVHSVKKDDKTIYEVELRVLWDTTQAAGEEMGTIEDTATDATAPTIVLTTPADGGTVTKETLGTVLWTFTETNQLDQRSIVYGQSVLILNTTVPATATLVAGTIAYDVTAKTITFTPTAAWTASDTFQAIITTQVQDVNGNHLAAAKIEQFSATA